MFDNDALFTIVIAIVSFLLGVVFLWSVKTTVFVREHKQQLYIKYNASIYLLKEAGGFIENEEISTKAEREK